MFENSKWICKKNDTDGLCYSAPYVIRDIVVEKQVKSAVLNVVSLGEGAYYIDGQRIEDSFRPTHPSMLDKTIIYNVYDVTESLSAGNHRFGAILGCHRFIHSYSRWQNYKNAMMILQLDIEYCDGTSECVVSDDSFYTHASPITFNTTLYGETYDARLEIKDWCVFGTSLDTWEKAAYAVAAPRGKFRTTSCPPIRKMKEYKAQQIRKGLYDFKITTAGHVRIKVTGKSGAEIKLVHAERLTPDGLHADQSALTLGPFPELYNSDTYILDGTKDKEFEQILSFHGFRYVEVIGEYDSIELTAVSCYTDIPVYSEFKCDNDMINKIHDSCVNSMLTCYQGMPLDNPKRDAPWLGDIMLDAEMYMLNFDAYITLYEYLLCLIDAQAEEGFLPNQAPTFFGWVYDRGERDRFFGPDWGDSAIIHIAYYMYKYTGKTQHIELAWDAMDKCFDYFETLEDGGLITNDAYGTGDWSAVYEKHMGKPEARVSVMSNMYYIIDIRMMLEMAKAIGKSADRYTAKLACLSEKMLDEYTQNGKLTLTHITEKLLAVYLKLVDEEQCKALCEKIADQIVSEGYAFTFGVHGIRVVFDVLSEYGYGELLFETLVNDKVYGYAKSIKDGLTCLAERFNYEKNVKMSLNHHFFSMVDGWFYKYLAGINVSFDGEGQKVLIKPLFLDKIKSVSATLNGIRVSYDENNLNIVSPCDFTLVFNDKEQRYSAGQYCICRE